LGPAGPIDWDIGLEARRGIGYVFSSNHTDNTHAEETLRRYVGKAGDHLPARLIKFDAGYREINWRKNCVSIGLSSGFFEPLEATGIVFTEVAAVMLSNLFPWGGDCETAARQYNEIMRRRYERALDFIKLHYCLTERRDTQFWRDNVAAASVPDSLHELLERWRHRPPDSIHIDPNVDIFAEASWQYLLYGMGYKTDLRPRAGVLRYYDEARAGFDEIKRQSEYACQTLPTSRELIEAVRTRSFGPAQ
jgi:tryptophan 7-halogenase